MRTSTAIMTFGLILIALLGLLTYKPEQEATDTNVTGYPTTTPAPPLNAASSTSPVGI